MTPEQRAKLTPEQLVIAEKWEKEQKEMSGLIEQLATAQENKDMKLWADTMEKIQNVAPNMCEHERSIWSNCAGCDEIEQILHPELFCAECGVPFQDEIERVRKEGDICSDCIFGAELS